MVSRKSRHPAPPPSRDRLLAAAAAEFAARGFDGATVDRIAARARVNKAMVYYHFQSKAGLYRAILRDVFAEAARAVAGVREAGGAPAGQVRRFVGALAGLSDGRPHFPAIWLREIADQGRHLDAGVLDDIRRVVSGLGAILDEGRRAGVFRAANPFVTQMAIVAPLLFLAATAPIRARLGARGPIPDDAALRAALVAHLQASTLAGLSPGSAVGAPARRSS